jgi:hypothetical protein
MSKRCLLPGADSNGGCRMTAVALLMCGVIGFGPEVAAKPSADDVAAYEVARGKVGRDAAEHVRLALWCEARGLTAERVKHLALATLIDPDHARARGLMGLVSFRDRWDRPETVAEKVKADPALAATLSEYNARREKTPDDAEAHWKLALWCEQHGLDAEATAHFTAVVRLDPAHDAARKRLGYTKVGGRWVTEEARAAEKAEAEAQKEADRHWTPLHRKWLSWLGEKARRDEAEAALAGVTDPRAVPSVWAVFVKGKSRNRDLAVQLLGQIDAAASSRALAFLAVFDDSPEVRRSATETLRRRDPREFAGALVGLLSDPIKYEVRPVGGPGSPGALFVEGKRFNVQRMYAPPEMPDVSRLLSQGGILTTDAYGLPAVSIETVHGFIDRITAYQITEAEAIALVRSQYGLSASALASRIPGGLPINVQKAIANQQPAGPLEQQIHQQAKVNPQGRVNAHSIGTVSTQVNIPVGQMALEARNAAMVAERQLEQDVAAIERANARTTALNDRAGLILNAISGQSLPNEPAAWKSWWVDQLGYRSDMTTRTPPVPTVLQNVPLDFTPQARPTVFTGELFGPVSYFRAISCFGAGTLVRTLDGSRPIESLKVGDRVLTQDTTSGALGYRPITAVHHNPPSPTFLVKVRGDTIVSSPFHRFWVSGRGWVMARDLKGGEPLRQLDGPSRVESVVAGPVQPVFNLDVASDHDFFAGASAALVHDNTLPDLRLSPFDAPPALASK